MNTHHHAATPTLSVIDPRALSIRSVGYCRHPDSPEIDPRTTRQRFDAAGRLVESWDPRLWGTAPKPNLTTVYGLSGQPLLTDSVDAGWQLSVLDQAGLPCAFWDARGSQRHTVFDEQQRPITVTEQAAGERPRVVERLSYGDSAPAFAEHNQCGQLIRHDDPAGTHWAADYGLAGAVVVEEQRLLADLETPDWPIEIDVRDEYLEAQSFITRHIFNPIGELQEQTDAMGNVRTFGYDVAGKPSEVWLQMAGESKQPQSLVHDIRYNAQDQVERETAGNGVLTHVEYAADDGRLIRLVAAVGNQKPLQDLNYVYDPVGNIVKLHDESQAVSHFNNQRIEPINRYRYDSLYQLVEAQGWEVSQPSHGPALPTLLPTPLDPSQRRNYTQCFEYDRGGNLISRQHSGAPGFSMFTSARSNRSLAQRDDGSLPGEPDIASGFDTGGNQQELQRGQAMLWDSRNQLSRVTLVNRETEPDDYECYRYDRPGHRLRKTGFTHSSGRTLRSEVRYLPGLEIHRQADGEEHHVISVEAGRSSVRALHWPEGAHNDQLRYSLSDHLGSSTLELDDEAGVLTREHYYPCGGTACWAGKSALVAKYKTIRYSDKERDATGLYYYGYRYYAPWLQRWISTDPAGNIDGLNMYCFCANTPITYRDEYGLVRGRGDSLEFIEKLKGNTFLARGVDEIKNKSPDKGQRLTESLSKLSEWSAKTVSALEQQTVEEGVKKIISVVYAGDVPVSELLPKIRVMDSAVKEYVAGNRDIILIGSKNDNVKAHVISRDPHKRIFISEDTLKDTPEEIAMTIYHEISHFKGSNLEDGLGSQDFIYLDNIIVKPDINNPNQQFLKTEKLHNVIARQSVSTVSGDKRQKFFKTPWENGIRKALNKSPELTTKVLLNNADSYAMLVASIGLR
ncbi:RHS repeat-associated core domain-containing protein [Pseudomonas fluorescens]|uniref:RHS repeat domain-containing protein n=1 Tax=Pseudomonas fluorescens TaxID=294 RepID=UPI003250F188